MYLLGIETSCDETAAAVVKDGKDVLSNVVVSSLNEHKKYGGVIPEIASRRQLEYIDTIVAQALDKAGVTLAQIDAVAVTHAPGLIGSLLVGISFARALSAVLKKPLIEVDHIKAHLYAAFLGKSPAKLPAIGLVVSGGHTSLFKIKSFQAFKLLGTTRDDAAGEAFDKVARILELGYPGGPMIDRMAKESTGTSLSFPVSEMPDSFDFSFSGIKTAVLYHQRKPENKKRFSKKEVAFAFQKSVVSILVKKSITTCLKFKIKSLVVGGGVAANSTLRQKLAEEARRHQITVVFPALPLCMDNAAMIAGLGYHLKGKGKV